MKKLMATALASLMVFSSTPLIASAAEVGQSVGVAETGQTVSVVKLGQSVGVVEADKSVNVVKAGKSVIKGSTIVSGASGAIFNSGEKFGSVTAKPIKTTYNAPLPMTYKKKVGVAKVILDGVSLMLYDADEKRYFSYDSNDGIPSGIIKVPAMGSKDIWVGLICDGYKTISFKLLLDSHNRWSLANPELDKKNFGNYERSMSERVPYLEAVFSAGNSYTPVWEWEVNVPSDDYAIPIWGE